MKFTANQADLRKALSLVSHAVPSKSTLPILQNILVSTDKNNTVRLTATNLELAMTCWIPANIASEGSITIPGKMLTDLISNLPSEPVVMSADTHMVSIQCAKFNTTMSGILAEEYPSIPTVDNNTSATFNRETLITVVSRVVVAAAQDDTRPVLTSLRWLINGTSVDLCAADGFRLARNTFEALTNPLEQSVEVLIPARTMAELVRLLTADKENDTVSFSANSNVAMFRTPTFELVSRLVDGKFPDIVRVIPTEHKGRTVIETTALSRAVKLSSLMNNLSIRMTFDEPGVYITSGGSQVGTGTAEVPAMHHGEKTNIALNVKYLQEALDSMSRTGISISISTVNETSPAVLRIVGVEDFTHVIMPMSVR